MKLELNSLNIQLAKEKFKHNETFQTITLPRLLILHYIKKQLKSIHKLYWEFEYNEQNTENNKINIVYRTNNDNFNFYYQVPLRQAFELRLFLANSSVHFIDIYNFMKDNNIIEKDKYPLRAQYRILPHFVLNGNTKRYSIDITNNITEDNLLEDTKVYNCIKTNIIELNSALSTVLSDFKE